nr:ribonuclease H-like domain-containing protein [Tanacetum cinerariifolium]
MTKYVSTAGVKSSWSIKGDHRFCVKYIENGNSFKPVAETTTNDASTSTTHIPGHVTNDEKAQKKNDVKARSMLLMALPNEHLMTFNQYKDAKTLFAAIETRFGGNEATKKTQKNLLKQLYENFSATSTDPNSTNEVPADFEVCTASPQVCTANLSDATVYDFLANQPNRSQLVHEDLEQIHEDDLEEMDLKWQMTLLSIRAKRFFQKTGEKITINGIGSRDRPPMHAMGRYAQSQSQFLRYIDTRPNGDALRKCILEGPYTISTVVVPAVPATENSLAVPEHTTVETIQTTFPKNKAHYESENKAILLILTGIGDEIYSTVDACKIAQEMIARNANPLALVATAQSNQDPYYQTPKSYKPYAPTSKASILTRSYATTINKGKEIAKPIIPSSKSASEEDSDPKQAQRDKDMQKNSGLITKYFKKIYKHTNNNLRTSSNPKNKNLDTTLRYRNDNQSAQFGNQRTMTVVGARENVGSPVQNDDEYNVFANVNQHCVQSESTSNTCFVEKDDSDVTTDSPDMCEDDIQTDQNAEDKRVALANLNANLKLVVDENKKIQKQLKKANTSLAHELEQCKSILAETSKTLGESNRIRDSCLVPFQTKQTEFEKYKACNDRTVDYDKLERKINETLGLLAQKDINIKVGLKLKAYEISVVKEKHDELVKQSLLTKSHYEGLVKGKIKVITNLKQKEDRDIDKMISIEKQLKLLNDIVYKINQTIQTIHMLAPKGLTFYGRPTFANPMYLKKAQSKKPCVYEISNDQSDPTNRLVPDREETLTLAEESRSKLNKDFVRPYDYTKLYSLYEIFKPASQGNHEQLAHANKVRKKMWGKSFVKVKPNIFKNIDFLPVLKSISKSRQAYNVMTNNINHFKEIVDQAWPSGQGFAGKDDGGSWG